MTAFMRVGNHYKLKARKTGECQGFHFVYPAGTVLRLEDVYSRDEWPVRRGLDEDGRPCDCWDGPVAVTVYSFSTVPQGYGLSLGPTDVEPATAAEVAAARPTVIEHPPGVSRRAV